MSIAKYADLWDMGKNINISYKSEEKYPPEKAIDTLEGLGVSYGLRYKYIHALLEKMRIL